MKEKFNIKLQCVYKSLKITQKKLYVKLIVVTNKIWDIFFSRSETKISIGFSHYIIKIPIL